MRMTSESDERMITINGEDSPSADDANIKGNVGGNGTLKKGPWTAAEDAILIEYVTKHGEGNWNAVQKHSGLARCGKSCRLRWANHLRPDLKKGAFTPEEESHIIELHAKMGNKWARMAAELPGRTDNEIKNYWNTRIKRRQRAGLSIYPDELTHLRSSNENQQNDDMNNFSSGNVHNHSDFMSLNNFEIPSVEFKNLELNHHIYTPGLLDFPAGNLLDIPPTSLLAQGLNSSYHNKSLLPTVHPSKRLRGSETFFHGLNPSTCNAFTGGSQYISDSPMQIDKSSVLSAYDHNSVDDHATSPCLPSGSHAVLNGNPSSEPAWAMKVELPSLQTQMGTWASPSPSSPFFDSVDILIQTPPNEHVQLCNLSPQNSGLLDAVLYESETMKTSKSIAIQQTPQMDINSANVHHEIDWDAYNEQLSPLGHSSSSVFSESTPISGTSLDEPYSAGALPVREEASNLVQVQYDDKVETKNQIFLRPDFLLTSNCFGRMKHHPRDHSLLKDAIGSFLGDELSNDCKNVDTGATSSAQSHGHDSRAWNTMPTV